MTRCLPSSVASSSPVMLEGCDERNGRRAFRNESCCTRDETGLSGCKTVRWPDCLGRSCFKAFAKSGTGQALHNCASDLFCSRQRADTRRTPGVTLTGLDQFIDRGEHFCSNLVEGSAETDTACKIVVNVEGWIEDIRFGAEFHRRAQVSAIAHEKDSRKLQHGVREPVKAIQAID